MVWSVSDFVAVFNQTLEYAYPSITIVGELANFRISKNRWIYFDLKDEQASVRFFGSVQQLSGPLEDGLMMQVRGAPRLHPLYGFSINVQFMSPVGEGSLKKASALLEAKLQKEGLFDVSRKRSLPYPPVRVGLITSGESAAFQDFVKIMNQRWVGVWVELADVQVQGEVSSGQIVSAIEYFNSHAAPVDTLVITRGGGSSDDLAAFNSEVVVRAVAASRIPTLVAIGHEVDISLAELAADQRASTPSNAAELLFPDKQHIINTLNAIKPQLISAASLSLSMAANALASFKQHIYTGWLQNWQNSSSQLTLKQQVLGALSPKLALSRGYSVVRNHKHQLIKSIKSVASQEAIEIEWIDGSASANITRIKRQ